MLTCGSQYDSRPLSQTELSAVCRTHNLLCWAGIYSIENYWFSLERKGRRVKQECFMLEQEGWLLYFTGVLLHLNNFTVKKELLHSSGAGDALCPPGAAAGAGQVGQGGTSCASLQRGPWQRDCLLWEHLGYREHAHWKDSQSLCRFRSWRNFVKHRREENQMACLEDLLGSVTEIPF